MSGEHELPTASVGCYAASAVRPPPWTTLHRMSEPQGSTYRSQFGVRTSGTTCDVKADPRVERIVDANQLYALFAGSM